MFNARTPTPENVEAAADRLRINGLDPTDYPGGVLGLDRDLELTAFREVTPDPQSCPTLSAQRRAQKLRNSAEAFIYMFGRAVGAFELFAEMAPHGPLRLFAQKAGQQAAADLETFRKFLAGVDAETAAEKEPDSD